MNKLSCNDESQKAVEFFKEHFDRLKPIKSFTAFTDSENFMLTKYSLAHASIHAIVENQQGETIEFLALSCGADKESSSASAEVLQLLGIEEQKAFELVLHNGLQINFNVSSSYPHYEVKTDAFFNGNARQKEHYGCNLTSHTLANVITHDVCMINPEKNNFTGLLNCLHVMQPVELEYSIEKRKPLIPIGYVLDLGYGRDTLSPIGTDGVNLIIRGNRFDVLCFIDYELLRGTLNAVSLYLGEHIPFTKDKVTHRLFISDEKIKMRERISINCAWQKE